ncbi:MAG: hypothetical protein IPI16_17410 [Comamonadaceae bacterium]|jgi:hypothetical protein|nr:hypothetical protein [Comamonadaceae bacterium]
MRIKVRQRQYAISLRGKGDTELMTKDVWTCVALVGVDKRRGIAFMAHFDTPFAVPSLDTIVEDLKTHFDDLGDFHLYQVTGISPFWGNISCGLLIAALPLVAFNIWLPALLGAIFWAFFGITRAALSRRLSRLNAFRSKPVFLGHSKSCAWLGKTSVRFDIDRDAVPEVRSYRVSINRHADYDTPKGSSCLLSKADGSN